MINPWSPLCFLCSLYMLMSDHPSQSFLHALIPLPGSKTYWANMGPTWGRQDPGGSHAGQMNFVIWVAGWWKSITVMSSCGGGIQCTHWQKYALFTVVYQMRNNNTLMKWYLKDWNLNCWNTVSFNYIMSYRLAYGKVEHKSDLEITAGIP